MDNGKLIMAAITLLIGAILIGVVVTEQYDRTSKNYAVDEVVSTTSAKLGYDYNATVNLGPVTNRPLGWKITDCPLESIVVTNASGTALTVTTDYTLSTTTGVLNMLNTSTNTASFQANNNTLIDYSYCADDYLNSSWGRSVLNMLGGFLALLLLGIALYYLLTLYKEFKE